LQQYESDNPLTRKLRTIEQTDATHPDSSGKGLPRFIDFVEHQDPVIITKEQMKLSDTMREMLADTYIILPLFTSQEPYGLAILDNRFSDLNRDFAETHMELLRCFSSQRFMALENAELFYDLQRTYEALREVDKIKSNFLS